MQQIEITTQLTTFAKAYGYAFRQCSPCHWQLVLRKFKFNVHYGRKGFCVVESHGLCNIRTATLKQLAGHILAITIQQSGDVQSETSATATAAASATETAPVKSSRVWATQFVVDHGRFPHALDYANAGFGTGSQCSCPTVGECVLRDSCNGHSCDRNCYTQQLQDYIAMSHTKRAEPLQGARPATTEALLARIRTMIAESRGSTIHIPRWAEDLLLLGAHLPDVRRVLRWQSGDWRPQSIYGLRCVWETAELVVV